MRLHLSVPTRLAPRIQMTVVAALLVFGGGAGALLYSLHRRDLIEGLRDSMTAQGALFEQGLRHAMLDRDLGLLETLIGRLGSEAEVEGAFLLDKDGTVRFSSDTMLVGTRYALTDPTCLICHAKKVGERGQTVVFRRSDGQRVLRNVTPIRNGPQCVKCHSTSDKINGVFVVDHSLGEIDKHLGTEAWVFAIGTVGAILALALVLELLLYRLVLRPIGQMRKAITAVERGHLAGGLEHEGEDEMARLAFQFSRMAESLGDTMALLQEREQYLQRILDSADDGMVVIDRSLRVVTSNEAYLRLCGKSRRDVVGEICCFSSQCRGEKEGDCPSWAVFASGVTQRMIRRLNDPTGEVRTYEIFASPLDVDGKPHQALEVWRDITERTRLEVDLAHSERLASLGLLASGISHEINNPLATITTCLDGLQRRYKQASEGSRSEVNAANHYFELIQKEILRCRDLTTKLTLFSRKSSPVREAVDVKPAVTETLSLLEFEVGNQDAVLECALDSEPLVVRGDETHLRQVVLNLLLNALDAIDRGGKIRVCATRREADWVEIKVSDDGCGIEAEDLARVFEPFYSKRRSRHGTGLGLFISNQIVRLQGGTIAVDSRAGEGTTVTVNLPAHGGKADDRIDLRTPGG